jgi:hypothetical protein
MILAHFDCKLSPTFFFAELRPYWQVARSRCRYVSDGFDLDLAYATWRRDVEMLRLLHSDCYILHIRRAKTQVEHGATSSHDFLTTF